MWDISHNNTDRNRPYIIEIYSKENGETPLLDFYSSLPEKMYTKALWTINLLEENGIYLRKPYSSPLVDGIFELRTIFGSDIIRTLFFFHRERIAVLTNGFIKKDNKTPPREIRKAKKYRKDWIRRHSNDI